MSLDLGKNRVNFACLNQLKVTVCIKRRLRIHFLAFSDLQLIKMQFNFGKYITPRKKRKVTILSFSDKERTRTGTHSERRSTRSVFKNEANKLNLYCTKSVSNARSTEKTCVHKGILKWKQLLNEIAPREGWFRFNKKHMLNKFDRHVF